MRLGQRQLMVTAAVVAVGVWLVVFFGELRMCLSAPRHVPPTHQLIAGAYLDLTGRPCHIFPIYAWNVGTEEHARYYAIELPDGRLLPAILPADTGGRIVGVLEPLSRRDQERLIPAIRQRFSTKGIVPVRLNGLRPVPSLAFWMSLPIVVWIAGMAIVRLIAGPASASKPR